MTQLFFKRLLIIIAERVSSICRYLDYREKQMEMVWEIVKTLICEEIDLLIGQHLDQLIICAIYAVSKKTGEFYQRKQLGFRDITER